MKLLFDQNLSRRLLADLEPMFPGSSHVQLNRLESALDVELWDFAKSFGYAIVTKDSDFAELATIRGTPPKIIWVNLGNVSNSVLRERLLRNADAIREFLARDGDGILEIE